MGDTSKSFEPENKDRLRKFGSAAGVPRGGIGDACGATQEPLEVVDIATPGASLTAGESDRIVVPIVLVSVLGAGEPGGATYEPWWGDGCGEYVRTAAAGRHEHEDEPPVAMGNGGGA